MVNGSHKDLPGRAASEKVLRDKAFATAFYPQYDGYQWFIKFSTKNLERLTLTQEQALFLKIINWLLNYTSLSLANFKKTWNL